MATFEMLYEWALLPEQPQLDISRDVADRALCERSFRWLRRQRIPEMCRSYKHAYELGWLLKNPVDVDLEPLRDIQLASTGMEEVLERSSFDSVWKRNDTYFALRSRLPLALYEFDAGGHWESMFLPNGEGSLEWRLGFRFNGPVNQSWLVMDDYHAERSAGIIPGVLTPRQLDAISESTGISVAIRPRCHAPIRPGDIIARMIPLENPGVRQ